MEELNKRVRQETTEPIVESMEEVGEETNLEEKKLVELIESSNISEAFFMARRLVLRASRGRNRILISAVQ